MIRKFIDFVVKCDSCHEFLIHPEDSSVLSFKGETVREDSVENIKEVAKDYGWLVNENKTICTNCCDK